MIEESWFGALGADGDTDIPRPGHRASVDRRAQEARDFVVNGAATKPTDPTTGGSRRARRAAAASEDTALRRIFRTYAAARATLGLLLALVP
jgi:hypothetical protein